MRVKVDWVVAIPGTRSRSKAVAKQNGGVVRLPRAPGPWSCGIHPDAPFARRCWRQSGAARRRQTDPRACATLGEITNTDVLGWSAGWLALLGVRRCVLARPPRSEPPGRRWPPVSPLPGIPFLRGALRSLRSERPACLVSRGRRWQPHPARERGHSPSCGCSASVSTCRICCGGPGGHHGAAARQQGTAQVRPHRSFCRLDAATEIQVPIDTVQIGDSGGPTSTSRYRSTVRWSTAKRSSVRDHQENRRSASWSERVHAGSVVVRGRGGAPT